jgi:N-acetylglucosaminyldiphosphoundecaprenol N-acetyl-beta-D-mannosaminyltransferase
MSKYFDINLEFDRLEVIRKINQTIDCDGKGYVCVVDGNVLSTSHQSVSYKTILNNSLINTCDGSSIAMLAGIIHRKKFDTYTGPEVFSNWVSRPIKQYFLGNTTENLNRLSQRFIELGYDSQCFKFASLPFKNVNDFDYESIAIDINEFKPKIIWVSLGAPKQEIFISKLIPFLQTGVLFAIGAAFNLYLNDTENDRAPLWMRRIHLEWLFRVGMEPKRVGKRAFRYICNLPGIIFIELKNRYKNKI